MQALFSADAVVTEASSEAYSLSAGTLARFVWANTKAAAVLSTQFISPGNVVLAIRNRDVPTLLLQFAGLVIAISTPILCVVLATRHLINLFTGGSFSVVRDDKRDYVPVFGERIGDAYAIPEGHTVENIEVREHGFRSAGPRPLNATQGYVSAKPPDPIMLLHMRPSCRARGPVPSTVDCEFSVFKKTPKRKSLRIGRAFKSLWRCFDGYEPGFFEAEVTEKFNHHCGHCGDILLFELRNGKKIMSPDKRRMAGKNRQWVVEFNKPGGWCMAAPCVGPESSPGGERTTSEGRPSDKSTDNYS